MANQEGEENEGLWAVTKAVHPKSVPPKAPNKTLKGAQNSVQPLVSSPVACCPAFSDLTEALSRAPPQIVNKKN